MSCQALIRRRLRHCALRTRSSISAYVPPTSGPSECSEVRVAARCAEPLLAGTLRRENRSCACSGCPSLPESWLSRVRDPVDDRQLDELPRPEVTTSNACSACSCRTRRGDHRQGRARVSFANSDPYRRLVVAAVRPLQTETKHPGGVFKGLVDRAHGDRPARAHRRARPRGSRRRSKVAPMPVSTGHADIPRRRRNGGRAVIASSCVALNVRRRASAEASIDHQNCS